MTRALVTLGILGSLLSACGTGTAALQEPPMAGSFEGRSPVQEQEVVPRFNRAMTTASTVEDEAE